VEKAEKFAKGKGTGFILSRGKFALLFPPGAFLRAYSDEVQLRKPVCVTKFHSFPFLSSEAGNLPGKGRENLFGLEDGNPVCAVAVFVEGVGHLCFGPELDMVWVHPRFGSGRVGLGDLLCGLVCTAELTNVGRGGGCSKKFVGPTRRIKMKGQMTVFCSIYVIQFQRQFLYAIL